MALEVTIFFITANLGAFLAFPILFSFLSLGFWAIDSAAEDGYLILQLWNNLVKETLTAQPPISGTGI